MTGSPARVARAVVVVAGSVLAALALVSCGDQPSAGAAVPGLTRSLDKVDSAVADERYRVARRALDQLMTRALEARRSGLLSPDQADRILGAAARLEHELSLPLPAPATRPQDEGESSDTEDSGAVRTEARPTVLLAVRLAVITELAAARQMRAISGVFSSTRRWG